jgi:hypothetical protein
MNRGARVWLFCIVLMMTTGCGLNTPNWLRPGSVPYQQSRANYHDPYVDDDAGPPVPSARPRSFTQPRAEPVRSTAFRDAFGGF